jgi:glycine cleavage system T protein (aminomethyltransferase)
MVADSPPAGSNPLLTSPLHDRSAELGARFAEFGGWSMPLEFSGAVTEHTAVRTTVGVFDVSHLGKAVVRGPGAAVYVNGCLTNDLGKIGPGAAQYTLCCDDGGGVVDDLIAYLRGPDEVFLVPNAANTAEVVRRLAASAPGGVEVVNQHRDYAVVAVQGRNSDDTLASAGLPAGHAYMTFVDTDWDGATITVCRTGYTGERGYEIVVPVEAAGSVWDAVLRAGERWKVVPAGLAARDTLRTEMGYPLHGQDLSLDITPVQARLGWAVGWAKETFWGADALRAERASGPARLLRGLVAVGRGIPRAGMSVYGSSGAEPVGRVTSGTFSPTLRKGIALGLLDAGVGGDGGTSPWGGEVSVDVRGRREPFSLQKPPFVVPEVPTA